MPSIAIPVSLRGQLLSGARQTLAGILFSNNEPGFTFEPWDITTLYQDRAGTMPVTAAGQSVGLRLDKSGRGNHQVAVSDAKRGVYGWMPKTGRRNLLTYTEQFDNAAWTKTNTTVAANAAVAPDGTTTADAITPTATGFFALQSYILTGTYTASISVKDNGAGSCAFAMGSGTIGYLINVNLATGAFISGRSYGGGTLVGYAITSQGNGWWRLTVSATATAVGAVILNADGTSPTQGVYIWGAQLEVGSTATAYQRVVSQYDITEAGVQTCYYVQADGVDDAYVTPTITPGTDKAQVFAGVRKLSDTAIGSLIELSATTAANNGSLQLATPGAGASANYTLTSKGTVAVASSYTDASIAAPVTKVITGLADISGDAATLRVNGIQVAQSTTDQGTGNFLAYPAYIYGRGGTSLPFNGLDFGHAVRFGPNLDAATIARVESLIARNTPGVTL